MTFFGGLIGVLLAIAWAGRRYKMGFLALTDIATFPAAFGLATGRITNFVNGELAGRRRTEIGASSSPAGHCRAIRPSFTSRRPTSCCSARWSSPTARAGRRNARDDFRTSS